MVTRTGVSSPPFERVPRSAIAVSSPCRSVCAVMVKATSDAEHDMMMMRALEREVIDDPDEGMRSPTGGAPTETPGVPHLAGCIKPPLCRLPV